MRSTEHSPSWGAIRLSVLLATVAALLLVPAAQAFANGNLIVSAGGAGSGEVNGVGGSPTHGEEEVFSGDYETSPPVECSYNGGTETTSGVCETPLNSTTTEGFEAGGFRVIPASGSEFTGYEFSENAFLNFCEFNPGNTSQEEEFAKKGFVPACFGGTFEGGGNIEFTAFFAPCSEGSVQGSCAGEPTEFPLTVHKTGAGTVTSSPAGIDCGEDLCSAEFEEGAEVTLTSTPETGSEFSGWSGSGCTGTGTCVVTMDEAKEVTATFVPTPRTLAVNEAGTGEGEVKCKFNGGSVGACTSPQPNGTAVELLAFAEAGSKFAGFSAGAGSASSCATSPCSFTIEANSSVTATFDLEPTPEFSLTVNTAGTGEGEVSCEVEGRPVEPCAAEYEEGTEVALVPEAETGSEFVKWSGDCTGTGACELTMDADKSVTATFDAEPTPEFKLTVAKAGTGQGSVTCNATSCAAEYPEGTEVTLAATAASGSTFTGWSGAGCSGTAGCKVTIEEDTAVTATFTATPKPEETCATNASLCPPPPPPPAETKCIVPKLAKKTLGQAKSALRAAHCALGKVTKPKKKGALVVKSSKPGAGTTLAAGAKVALKLGLKPKKK
jgi:hypothetical protein